MTMMKHVLIALSLMLCFSLQAMAQDAGKKNEPKKSSEITIVGEVVDAQCYLQSGAKGDDHKQCAVDCAKGGIPLAILENKTGDVYFVGQTKNSMKGANDMLIDYASEQVSVTGKLVERGGAKMILMKSVAAAK